MGVTEVFYDNASNKQFSISQVIIASTILYLDVSKYLAVFSTVYISLLMLWESGFGILWGGVSIIS